MLYKIHPSGFRSHVEKKRCNLKLLRCWVYRLLTKTRFFIKIVGIFFSTVFGYFFTFVTTVVGRGAVPFLNTFHVRFRLGKTHLDTFQPYCGKKVIHLLLRITHLWTPYTRVKDLCYFNKLFPVVEGAKSRICILIDRTTTAREKNPTQDIVVNNTIPSMHRNSPPRLNGPRINIQNSFKKQPTSGISSGIRDLLESIQENGNRLDSCPVTNGSSVTICKWTCLHIFHFKSGLPTRVDSGKHYASVCVNWNLRNYPIPRTINHTSNAIADGIVDW